VTNQKESEYHYLQALQRVARLENLTFLETRPSLLYNLRTDQVAAHLGLGSLYRDQKLDQKAMEQLTKAHDPNQELITIEDSLGQQDRLGVILTTHGEFLNTLQQATPEDSRNALDKQQRAVTIFRQLAQTTIGLLREQTLCKLMEALLSMADTVENLDLYKESQGAMREAQIISKRAQTKNNTNSIHLHQQIFASTKETIDARRELDDHTSTLHVGSKIRQHGLLNQTINGKKGTVLRPAINNRIGIQLQGENRQVSIRILNIRYWKGPEQNRRTLYDNVVAKAQAEIDFLSMELQIQIKISGHKHIDTALARYNLGKALRLSNKSLETTQAVGKFQAAILFMTQREPSHHSLSFTEKVRHMALESIAQFKTPGTLSTWELLAMTGREKEATITANTILHGLRRHGLHDFGSPILQLIDQTTLTEMACELEKMEKKTYKIKTTSPRPTTSITKLQSAPSSAGDDT